MNQLKWQPKYMDGNTEIERTFLAKYLPTNISAASYQDIIDIYVPFSSPHPHLRIRKQGTTYAITKKMLTAENIASVQHEQSIPLTVEEYDDLATIPGKRIIKRRYLYPSGGKIAMIDIFVQNLAGLVVIDFEFPDTLERDSFVPPDFCLAEVTNEEFIAGGVLAGKLYLDLTADLNRFGYKPLSLQL